MDNNHAPRFTVLVVDDSIVVRRRIVALLDEAAPGTLVVEAADPDEGIEAFHRMRPDVVVLDLSMPGGSGLDVLREIRKVTPPRMVIVFTNHIEEPYRRHCLEGGADLFLDKSKDLPRLVEVLRDRHQARRSALS
jgi:DNA-binding NarL/FixJ family response regulator